MRKLRMTTRTWLITLYVIGMTIFLGLFAARVAREARKSGDDDRIRIKVRSGELPPEAGKGIMAEEEIEFLKKGKTPDGRPWWEQG